MKRYIAIFAAAAFFSISMIIYGCIFVDSKIGEVILTEETISGSSSAAAGLEVSLRADSADDLHWIGSYNYSTGKTDSMFKRGEMPVEIETFLYDDIRFNGSSTVPYSTELKFESLGNIQGKKLHEFFDELQHDVMKSGEIKKGKIRLSQYLDYYPISFRFQLGTKILNSDSALTGLKIYDEQEKLSTENTAVYNEEIELYKAFNEMFRIPVIENEYHKYEIAAKNDYNEKKSLGYNTKIERTADKGEDYYFFDPTIMLQEENIFDGKKWHHPDLEDNAEKNGDGGKMASDYKLKNRMLFIVNNRTAKGFPVDVSKLDKGYGIYELPIDVTANASVKKGKKSWTVPDPVPLIDEMKMIYPLDAETEYIELSLSPDHRHLVIFSVREGFWNVEIIDADRLVREANAVMFPASHKLVYAWGDDGSLAATNHDGYVAVFEKNDSSEEPYHIIYKGKTEDSFGEAFFDTDISVRKDFYAEHICAEDKGLELAVKDGKAALVQNLIAAGGEANIRNAALECAVIDESGVLYRGILKSNITDMDYSMSKKEIELIVNEENAALRKQTILPVRNENRAEWDS